jgi:aminoglycoside phosphotransferase family enzyme/predicted kinase
VTAHSEHDAIVRWLARREAYPHHPPAVERIETHISQVFLAGDQVYKLKKPVQFDFLDFSTLAAREFACREELRLNRRLAADTYLDVVPVTRSADQATGEAFQLRGDGEVVDWLVHMRRLPTDETLEAIVRRGELRPEQIEQLGDVLAAFYARQPPLQIAPADYRARVLSHVSGNRRELLAAGHHLPRHAVQRIHAFQLQLLQLEPGLLEARASAGRIIDGHGDLRPEHICLAAGTARDRIAIFDCIEFNTEFRQLDVVDELAFLAAECDFLGCEWVGPQLFARYERQSGDRPPEKLISFYQSYRACVRAKVAALRADQMSNASDKPFNEAQSHLEWADRYAEPWLAPLVIAVGGLSGTGKTTLAAALAESLGAELLRTDVVRQELFGARPQQAPADSGVYSPGSRARVYDELFRRARELTADGVSVVLDGTFAEAEHLQQAAAIGQRSARSRFLAVECVCPPEVARARIAQRLAAGQDASEAQPATHDLQRSRWQPWPAEISQVRIDTSQPLEDQTAAAIAFLRDQSPSGCGDPGK